MSAIAVENIRIGVNAPLRLHADRAELRAAEKHGLDLKRSIMVGDKDSDMQAAKSAGAGVRCHYLADGYQEVLCSAATHKIHSLREGISLLNGLADA